MKRLTYRDNEGRAQWAPELLEDNTGMAESVKLCSISGKAKTICGL